MRSKEGPAQTLHLLDLKNHASLVEPSQADLAGQRKSALQLVVSDGGADRGSHYILWDPNKPNYVQLCRDYITFRPLILRFIYAICHLRSFSMGRAISKRFISCFLMSLFTLFQHQDKKTNSLYFVLTCYTIYKFWGYNFFNKLTFVPNSHEPRRNNPQRSCSNKIFTNVRHRYSVLAVY